MKGTLLIALLALGCSAEAPHVDEVEADQLYSTAISHLVFEVDYAAGAEPRAVRIKPDKPIWNIFRTNVETVFEGQNKTFQFPESTADMTNIGELSDESFTTARIVEIAAEHRDHHIEGNQVAFYVLFLNGHFHDGEEIRTDVLGASLGDTGIIAMFHPAIEATATEENPSVPTYVQQATLTHEFGHAVGLVNRQISLHNDHHDAEHGNHCTNEHCVMHYRNEGAASMASFISRLQSEQTIVIFGPDCLVDARVKAGLDATPPDTTLPDTAPTQPPNGQPTPTKPKPGNAP